MKYITIVNIISKMIFTFAIFIFIHKPQDYLYVPILNGLGFIIGGILSLYIIKKDFNQIFEFQNFNTLMKYFKDSAQFFLSRVSVTLYTTANTFVLGLFTNNTMVGYYSIAEKLYMAIQSLYSPIVNTLYPYVSKEKNIKLFKKIFYISIVCNILGITIIYFLDKEIFSLLFSQKVGIESIKVFHIFLIANIVVVPTILIGYPYLGALGYAKYANLSVVFGSIIHLLGLTLFILLHKVNIYNIAFMVVLTELIVFIQRIFWVKEKNLWQEP